MQTICLCSFRVLVHLSIPSTQFPHCCMAPKGSPIPSFQSLTTTNRLCVSADLRVLVFYVNELGQYVAFFIWPPSLPRTLYGLARQQCYRPHPSRLGLSSVWVCLVLFRLSSSAGHPACFCCHGSCETCIHEHLCTHFA